MFVCDRCGELPMHPTANAAAADEVHEIEHFLATGCRGCVTRRPQMRAWQMRQHAQSLALVAAARFQSASLAMQQSAQWQAGWLNEQMRHAELAQQAGKPRRPARPRLRLVP